MCTPCTMTRLVRWRVRDWASCFLACRFSIDEDRHDRYFSSTVPQLAIRNNMGLETKNNADSSRGISNNIKAKRRLTRQKKCNRERVELELGSSTTTEVKDSSSTSISSTSVPVDQNRKNHDHQEPSWPHFEDEDYIVFCFKEDGAFDVVKDGYNKSEAASNRIDCRARSSSRPVNRKDEEEDSNYVDMESASGGIAFEDRRMVSVESSDSTQSDASNGSFAFPVLGWEWTGSPVQMPKSEGLRLRKHKGRCVVGFQCCRF
ncbi:hypothetical protein FNV43_RR20770 [Rhamnella rubrinervis]|uniref:Uncharacterized protein n=1 Tax=Rhamnella rubrinervis TaxID=2594499 RepID=A0A8K0E1C7_9ROSA|nr:hypothetical protein FNV43_RR20770 [Rhamnella rubrinervis]